MIREIGCSRGRMDSRSCRGDMKDEIDYDTNDFYTLY